MSKEYKNRSTSPPNNVESARQKRIALAHKLIEKQLKDGTASSQVLKMVMDSERDQASIEKIRLENERLRLTIEREKIGNSQEQQFEEVLNALKRYRNPDV